MNIEPILKWDAEFSNRLRVAEQPGTLRNIAAFLGHSGDSWFWLAGLLLMLLIPEEFWRRRAIFMIAAILITAAFVMILKFTIRRARPEGEWGQIYRKTDPHSFPSGHAARGILIGVVAMGLGPTWVGWPLLIWGPLVGIARVAMGVHYVSDVLAGWVMGIGMGLLCLNFLPSLLF